MSASAAELLATVERSPQAVAAHDRPAWVAVFAPDARVEDPVGSGAQRGTKAIERFYETFIAPNTIVFAVDHDVVCGMTVYRDLTVETTMSTGVTMRVPMHLRYDLTRRGEELKIARLQAHWELPVMVGQLLAAGVPGLTAAARLVPQLLGNQGVGGALGFARGFVRVGARGKRVATGPLVAAGRGDGAALRAALAPGAVLQWDDASLGVEGFVARADGLRADKTLGAGRYVTATVTTAAGRGVAEIEMARGATRIAGIRVFMG